MKEKIAGIEQKTPISMKQAAKKRIFFCIGPAIRKRWAFAIFLFLFWMLPISAQVSVSAELSQNEILIGDQIKLTILSYYQPPTEISDVGFSVLNGITGLEVLRAERFEKDNGEQGKLLEIQIAATSFDSGYYRIPPIPVLYRQNGREDTAWTQELGLRVNTFPITTDSVELQPIKDIIGEPMNIWDTLPWLVGIFLLAGLGLFIFFMLRRPPPPLPPPPPIRVPIHQLALEQLEQLESRKLWQQGQVKDYHSGLTHIIREYLEKRYHLAALESTTDQILQQLGHVGLSPEWQKGLRRLLQSADLVKFAKATPPASYHTEALEEARSFIRSTQDEEAVVEIAREIPGFPGSSEEASINPPPYILDTEGEPLLLAGFWRRFFARLLDIYVFPFLVLLSVFLLVGRPDNQEIGWLLILPYLAGLWLYHALMDHFWGGPAGKLLLGIRVTDEKGRFLSFGRASLRFLGKLISESFFWLGYLFYFLNRNRRQTLHDMMAQTFVIRKLPPVGGA